MLVNSVIVAFVGLASAGWIDAPIKVKMTKVSAIDGAGGFALATAPEGRAALATLSGDSVTVYSVDLKVVATFREKGAFLTSVALAGDGKTVVVGGESAEKRGIVVIYEIEQEKETFRMSYGKATVVQKVACKPKSSLVAVIVEQDKGATRPTHLSLVDSQTGKWIPIPEFIKAPETIASVSFDAKGKYMAVGTIGGWARVYDYGAKTLVREARPFEETLHAVRMSGDGKWLAAFGNVAKVLDVDSGKEKCRVQYERGLVLCSEFSADNRLFFLGGMQLTKSAPAKDGETQGIVKVVRLSSGEEVISKALFTSCLFGMGMSRDGKTLITCGLDVDEKEAIRVWKLVFDK